MKVGVSLLIKKKTDSQWHEDDLRIIENYRPLDDDFMRELFRNDLPLAQLVLRIITGIDDLKLTSQETQFYKANLSMRKKMFIISLDPAKHLDYVMSI